MYCTASGGTCWRTAWRTAFGGTYCRTASGGTCCRTAFGGTSAEGHGTASRGTCRRTYFGTRGRTASRGTWRRFPRCMGRKRLLETRQPCALLILGLPWGLAGYRGRTHPRGAAI